MRGKQGRGLVSDRRAIGYVRISKEEEGHPALSISGQEEALRVWAERSGVELIRFEYDRDVSGGAPLARRVGLLAAIASLREEGAGVLLVLNRDRLARNTFVSAWVDMEVAKQGAQVRTVAGVGDGDGPEEMFARRILDAAAEFERALIAQRTKRALGVKKKAGMRTGQVPYGFFVDRDGFLQPAPEQQAAIARILELRAEGVSLRLILRHLEGEGIGCRPYMRHGKKRMTRWHLIAVVRVLRQHALDEGEAPLRRAIDA